MSNIRNTENTVTKPSVLYAKTEADIKRCFGVIKYLRPDYAEQDVVTRVLSQLEQGYQLVYIESEGQPVYVAGYRFLQSLAWKHFMYVDDLITAESVRSQGFGQVMIDYLIQRAIDEGCDELHLASGVQRFGAHRFYLRNGFDITSHHFALNL